ncbi:MAG: redox-sensing transcriptional repressor Rex [Elusimicrobiota bacterium]
MLDNKNLISRLLKYRNILIKLKNIGMVKVFSENLSDASGFAGSQIRKDLSTIGIEGKKKGGYNLQEIMPKLDNFLGKNEEQKIIIVGCGRIGRAIIEYENFHNNNMKIVAGFDTDEEKQSTVSNPPIYPLSELPAIVKNHQVKLGIITVPESCATEVYEQMIKSGIKGILNFARVHLHESENVFVNTMNIEFEIENLSYFVNVANKMKGKKEAVR